MKLPDFPNPETYRSWKTQHIRSQLGITAGLSHQLEETTLRDVLLRELRNSSRLKFDLEVYDRAKEGSEQRTYECLLKCVKELLTRERTGRNRTAIAKEHGAKYGTPAPSDDPAPSTPRGHGEKKPYYAFQRGKCPKGDKCPFEHVKPREHHQKAAEVREKVTKAVVRQRAPRASRASSTPRAPARMVRSANSFTRTLTHLSRPKATRTKVTSRGPLRRSAGVPARRAERVPTTTACCIYSSATLTVAVAVQWVAFRGSRPQG